MLVYTDDYIYALPSRDYDVRISFLRYNKLSQESHIVTLTGHEILIALTLAKKIAKDMTGEIL